VNANCLEGLQCPKCGSYEPFLIAVEAKATVYDNGVDETREENWEDDSPCSCMRCWHVGTVRDFAQQEKETKDEN